MTLEIQFKLKKNPVYLEYLHENSYLYKYLNRDPSYFKKFEDEVREKMKLRASDKIEKMMETISLLQNMMINLKQ